MLLLPSRKSGSLNNPDMVLSQIHSFMTNANCDDERESNNNSLITEKDVLRTPPHKCRFEIWKSGSQIISNEFWRRLIEYLMSEMLIRHGTHFPLLIARVFIFFFLIELGVLIKIEYFMNFNHKLNST